MQDTVKKEYAESYLKLNSHQKDFLDLEKGFSKDKKLKERKELAQEVNELYKNMGNSTFEVIGLGFSDKYLSFKSKFSFFNFSISFFIFSISDNFYLLVSLKLSY